jgi:hypothetical protein
VGAVSFIDTASSAILSPGKMLLVALSGVLAVP